MASSRWVVLGDFSGREARYEHDLLVAYLRAEGFWGGFGGEQSAGCASRGFLVFLWLWLLNIHSAGQRNAVRFVGRGEVLQATVIPCLKLFAISC